MNEEKAKFILSGGVPREGDAEQEGIREALETAKTSPSVDEWMTRQQAVTDALHRKFNEVSVPTELRERILAGESAARSRRRVSRRSILAMAAAIAVLLSLAILAFLPSSGDGDKSFAGLRSDMTDFLSGFFTLEHQSNQLDKLQAYLAAEHRFVADDIPAALANNPGVGCRMIEWRDTEVALICFDVDGELVHLLILPRNQLPEPVIGLGPYQEGAWATNSWTDERNTYLVATRGDAAFLKRALGETEVMTN